MQEVTVLDIIEKNHGTQIVQILLADLWNSLPNQLFNAETVNDFKAGFDCWMSSNQENWLS